MDVDLRKLRYFVAVAEQLHFGRAAAALHIAQPVLSRQIRALEDELHVQLFLRDRRSTELTAAGRQLLDDARPLLASAEALRRRAARAARGSSTFTVGFMPGITVTSAVRALTDRHPDLQVELVRTTWVDQVEVLRDGRVDVSIVRLPIEARGLRLQPMYTDPRVVALRADHRLAGKESITIADLADEHLLQDPDAVPEWRDIAVELLEGTSPGYPRFSSVEEKSSTSRRAEESRSFPPRRRSTTTAPTSLTCRWRILVRITSVWPGSPVGGRAPSPSSRTSWLLRVSSMGRDGSVMSQDIGDSSASGHR